MEFKPEQSKTDKIRNQKILQDSFLSTLSNILSIYPNLTINEHLDGIKLKLSKLNRAVGGKDNVKYGDERLVKACERYMQDLENDPPQLWGTGADGLTEEDIIDFYDRNS
jgi:hypothetical protein